MRALAWLAGFLREQGTAMVVVGSISAVAATSEETVMRTVYGTPGTAVKVGPNPEFGEAEVTLTWPL